MEQITIGQIVAALAVIVSFIGSVGYIKTHIKKWIADSLKEQFAKVDSQFDKVDERIDHLENHMEGIDVATCKNFLVARLSEIEKGSWWNDIETERFWEQYEHYRKHGGNTYIQTKVEKLKDEGKL